MGRIGIWNEGAELVALLATPALCLGDGIRTRERRPDLYEKWLEENKPEKPKNRRRKKLTKIEEIIQKLEGTVLYREEDNK